MAVSGSCHYVVVELYNCVYYFVITKQATCIHSFYCSISLDVDATLGPFLLYYFFPFLILDVPD